MTKVKDCLNETNGEHLETSHALSRRKWAGSHEKERECVRKVCTGEGTGLADFSHLDMDFSGSGA